MTEGAAADRVHVIGGADDALQMLLADAGLRLDASAPLQLLPWPAQAEQLDRDGLFVALVASEGAADAARRDGALDAVVLPLPAAALRARLSPLLRTCETWRKRLRGEVQRARRASAELQSARDLFGRLIDATPNPVMASDMRGRVLVFNRSAEAALGYDSRWARENMHVTEIYADAGDARRVLAEIRNSPSGLVQAVDVRLRSRSGEHIPVLLSAAEVYAADGMPIATVGVFQDQRQELALRNRLEETTEQLIATEKRAAAIEVAGAAAHELNQPLTAVMGSLEMLELRADLPEDVHRRVERAYEQLERMADIVRRLAETTRPRSRGYVGQTRILDLHANTE